MRLRWTIVLLSSLVGGLWSMEARFQADSLRGTLGDVIQFGWRVAHEPQDSLYYTLGDLEDSGIEVLSQSLKRGKRESELQFKTAVYDSVGLYHFPNAVLYRQNAGKLDSLFLRGPDLEIYSVLSPADTSFRDIKGLHHIRRPFHWILLLWITLAALLIYALIRLLRLKRRRMAEEAEQIVIIPPEQAHLIALRDLEHLRREKFLRLQQFKEFHSRLTHILKQYLENRYLIDALEYTSSELMQILERLSELESRYVADVRGVLDLADLIKFAKAESNELESGKSLNQVVEFVNHTKIENDMGDDT